MNRVKIVTFVPSSHADTVRLVLGAAGAGKIGKYSYCSFTTLGKGRYKASDDAKPFIGKAGESEVVEEERIEVVCERSKARDVIVAMRQAHPYEEVAFDIYPIIDELDL